ncbi:hypothetical protein HDU97_008911 [Phlyctochytrium planicorne]|nr:hypothetical protein HDU97_008911 [Phlyctochytrium planicorne]
MHQESFLAKRLRSLESVPKSFPTVEVDEFGCVAIVDISESERFGRRAIGPYHQADRHMQPPPFFEKNKLQELTHPQHKGFTRLTDELEANGVANKIRDILNPPFEKIIETVHRRGGSVIKLAGDSAIVVWTHPKQPVSPTEQENASLFATSLMCCMELLELFEDFQVESILSQNPKRALSETSYSSGGNPHPTQPTPQILPKRKPTAEQHKRTSTLSRFTNITQTFQLHIGLGFGPLHHVFVGTSQRAEYFVAGPALRDAGIMLNYGKPGQMAFDMEGYELMNRWILNVPNLKKSIVVMSCTDDIFTDVFGALQIWNTDHSQPSQNEGTLTEDFPSPPTSAFIEPSLLKHLSLRHSTVSSSLSRKDSTRITDPNQFRAVTILFLRLTGLPIHSLHTPAALTELQIAATESIRIASKYGGTCRQINADEKCLSVLIIWGVEGFSHEKGDHLNAISAGIEISKILEGRDWSGLGSGGGEEKFSIAITIGRAFAGIIGTETRCDGTVLGPCVNKAARIMCHPFCNGQILCDEVVAEMGGENFKFELKGSVFLKGFYPIA